MTRDRMTVAKARATLRAVGVTIRNTGSGEYRIAISNNPEGAYFTTSLADAVATGLTMAKVSEAVATVTPLRAVEGSTIAAPFDRFELALLLHSVRTAMHKEQADMDAYRTLGLRLPALARLQARVKALRDALEDMDDAGA